MGKFKKGTPKPLSSGRKKGSQNKDLKPIREKFNQLLDGYSIEDMIDDLRSLEPKDRLNIINGISEYIIPKLARTELTGADGDAIQVRSFSLGKASERNK